MILNPKANPFSPNQNTAQNPAFDALNRDFGPFGPLHLTSEDQQTEKGGKIFISHPSDPQVEIILPQVTIEKPQNARKTSNSNMNISAVKNQHQHQTRMHPTRAL
jgi:hypothetical protein